MGEEPDYRVTRLACEDRVIEAIPLPGGVLTLTTSVGSGLAWDGRRLWGLGDRGPNLKLKLAVETYGVEALRPHLDVPGAKLMPRPAIGPAISELRITGDTVQVVRTLPLTTPDGHVVSGVPQPGGDGAEMEPAFDLTGKRLRGDPEGADTESLAVMADGSFWVGEEYEPSVMRVGPTGVVERRLRPGDGLPMIAARRRLNRGLEALAMSGEQRFLYMAFQSALALPDVAAGEACPYARIWKYDLAAKAVTAQWLYEFDPPESFARDGEDGPVTMKDLKICDIAWLGEDRLLVLERVEKSARIYRVDLKGRQVGSEHLDETHRPSLEETPDQAPRLEKTLLLSTDVERDIDGGLEGMAVIDPHTLILATDNDFGIEGAATQMFRVRFAAALA